MNQQAIRSRFSGLDDRTGNLPSLPGTYPDYFGPIIRSDGARRIRAVAGSIGATAAVMETRISNSWCRQKVKCEAQPADKVLMKV